MSDNIMTKQAIVLAGGASHGAYQVGVFQALMSKRSPCTNNIPLNPGIIAGISAGAFNAAALLSQIEVGDVSPADTLQRIWLKRIAGTRRKNNGVFRFRGDSFDILTPRNVLRQGPIKAFSNGVADFFDLSGEGLQRAASLLPARDLCRNPRNLVVQAHLHSKAATI